MGIEIHIFVEYWVGGKQSFDPDYEENHDGPGYFEVECLTAGEFHLPGTSEILDIFGYYSGCKSKYAPAKSKEVFIEPRGLPVHVSEEVFNRYYIAVLNQDTDVMLRLLHTRSIPRLLCSDRQAEHRLSEGISKEAPR